MLELQRMYTEELIYGSATKNSGLSVYELSKRPGWSLGKDNNQITRKNEIDKNFP